MIGITKSKNGIVSNEEQIFDVNLMNSFLEDRERANSIVIQKKGFVDYINRAKDFCANFSLYENIYIDYYTDDQKIQKRANGFYTHIKKLTFTKEYLKRDYGNEIQFSYSNPNFENQRLKHVYVYDANMAYLSVFKYGIYPDTDNELGPGFVEEDEIGFINDIEYNLRLVETGLFAMYRFKKVYSKELQKWAWDNYNKRNLAKSQGQKEKQAELKQAIVSALGIISNHNIFLRSYITGTIYNYMESLIDENTLLANTDSIFSLVPRNDLDIGKGLGQFKVEFEDKEIIYEGSGYNIYDPNTGETLVTKWRGRLKGEQEGYDPLTKVTVTPRNYEKIGEYIYEQKNS